MTTKFKGISIKQSGLTLIEVVISITILGMILALLMGSIYMAARNWNIIETYTDTADSRRLGIQFMEKQIRQTVPLRWKDETGERAIFHGSARQIRFVSRLPSHFGKNGMKLVSFVVNGDGPSKRLIFGYQQVPGDIDPFKVSGDFEAEAVSIIENMYDLHIDYFGKTNARTGQIWHSSWINQKQLPDLVRLRIKYQQTGRWQELVFPVFAQIDETLPQLTVTKPGVEPPLRNKMKSGMELF